MDAKEKKELLERIAAEFGRLNRERFDGELPEYGFRLSLRAVRTHGSIDFGKQQIMISIPLYRQYGWEAVRNTLLHEMTHAFIHVRGGQARHTKRFWREFEARGGVRDRVDVEPDICHVYECPTCGMQIKRMRRLKRPWLYSCLRCDKRYNPRHRLRKVKNTHIYN